MRMNAELLTKVEEGLRELIITSNHPSSHPQYNQLLPKIPIACLTIPHKFFLVADRIQCLKKTLQLPSSDLIEMANVIIEDGSDKIRNDASLAEDRLVLKSRR